MIPPHPLSFNHEISNLVYGVNAHRFQSVCAAKQWTTDANQQKPCQLKQKARRNVRAYRTEKRVEEVEEGSEDEMYTDLSEIWDVTLINPNLL